MARKQSIFLAIWIMSSVLFAQERHFEFLGALTSPSLVPMSIKLSLDVAAEGAVSGVTITDFKGSNHTESRIEGTWDASRDLLSFREVENLKTKSSAPSHTFCFIRVDGLQMGRDGDQRVLKGTFKGFFPDSQVCARGNIYLIGAEVLERIAQDELLIQEIKEKIRESNEAPILEEEELRIIQTLSPDEPLRARSVVPLNWKTGSIRLDLWDSYEEDHDRLSIYLNDELVHAQVEARERKKSFEFEIAHGAVVKLRVTAENEGDRPPNTVSLNLYDGDRIYPAVTKLRMGESVIFQILRDD